MVCFSWSAGHEIPCKWHPVFVLFLLVPLVFRIHTTYELGWHVLTNFSTMFLGGWSLLVTTTEWHRQHLRNPTVHEQQGSLILFALLLGALERQQTWRKGVFVLHSCSRCVLRCMITSVTNYDYNIIQAKSFHPCVADQKPVQTKSDICASERRLKECCCCRSLF